MNADSTFTQDKTSISELDSSFAEAEQKTYKLAQQKRIACFEVGRKDINGNEILSILSKSDEWVIYQIKTQFVTESLKVYIDTVFEDDPGKIIEAFDTIKPSIIKFKGELYKVNEPGSYMLSAAQIISQGLAGHTGSAISRFDEVIREIGANYVAQFYNRLVYMIGALFLVSLSVIFSVLIYSYEDLHIAIELRMLTYVCTAASIGGFISISRKLKQMVFERGIKSKWFFLYAIERIFISIFAGVVVYFAIKSDLVFGQLKSTNHPVFSYLIFAIAAGFSETFIPNLLINFENRHSAKH